MSRVVEGFKAGMAFIGADFFADKNVFAIVLEVPNSLFHRQPVGYWTTVLLEGQAGRADGPAADEHHLHQGR